MAPDPKWLEILDLPLKSTLGVAVATGLLLLLDYVSALDLSALGELARTVTSVIFVASGAFAVVQIAEVCLAPLREKRQQSLLAARRAVRRAEMEELRAVEKARAIAHLDHLSSEELRYIADCLRKGSPSFYTYVYDPAVSNLQGKRIVWTPGGPHNQDYYPFNIHDFVWTALLERKDEFIRWDDENRSREEEAKKINTR